ncbi:four helix bundle protein [Bacteroidales bacterium OttesenSCG-928-I21]|nr:four helix bundle protein [Bacteroidales bacterium OttesenSCG-928-I21]
MSVLRDKSFDFAVMVVKLVRKLQNEEKEFVLSKQLMRSGTAIGALISEAQFGQSNADFVHKMNIALKEANETKYWLELLFATDYITNQEYDESCNLCKELIAMLVSTLKTIREKLNK